MYRNPLARTPLRPNKAPMYAVVAGFLVATAFSLSSTVMAAELPDRQRGLNLNQCVEKLNAQDGGWCEIRGNGKHASISAVWPEHMPKRLRMITGPTSILQAWNSATYDEKRALVYFTGGGHADYGGNGVYEFDLNAGKWSRLTDPSPLDYLFIAQDYNQRAKKPWRRLCWMPDVRKVPGSAHTYDGLQFSQKTDTVFYYSMRTANGSCFEDKQDEYRDHPAILGKRLETSTGWYEFNPDRHKQRNGLAPLTWRKVFDYRQLKAVHIERGLPAAAELGDGSLVFGSSTRTTVYDPTKPDANMLHKFTDQPDWGDGTKLYDAKRNLIWSIHHKMLIAFDANSGRLVQKHRARVDHGKSIAIDKQGVLVFWGGGRSVFTFNPDERKPKWRVIDWVGKDKGPPASADKVYGKWMYLSEHDVFVGLATHRTGVMIYKQPQNIEGVALAGSSAQTFIDKAKAGDRVVIPPGVYGNGLFINKSLNVGLSGVTLRGVAKRKGIINVNCNGCEVVIEDFKADGKQAGCTWGACAGVKAEGVNFNLTLKRAHISETVMGILTDNRGGSLTLEDSLIENTGLDDRSNTLGHGFYAGQIDKVVIRNSIIRSPYGDGHVVKSRAPDTLIENSIVAGITGHQSRTIDFPCGGTLMVRNSTLQHSENADNADLISVGTEPGPCKQKIHPSRVTLFNNWIIVDRDQSSDERAHKAGGTALFNWHAPLVSVDVTNNRIVEPTGRLKYDIKGKVRKISKQNIRYRSRKEAGLGAMEIPKP